MKVYEIETILYNVICYQNEQRLEKIQAEGSLVSEFVPDEN